MERLIVDYLGELFVVSNELVHEANRTAKAVRVDVRRSDLAITHHVLVSMFHLAPQIDDVWACVSHLRRVFIGNTVTLLVSEGYESIEARCHSSSELDRYDAAAAIAVVKARWDNRRGATLAIAIDQTPYRVTATYDSQWIVTGA